MEVEFHCVLPAGRRSGETNSVAREKSASLGAVGNGKTFKFKAEGQISWSSDVQGQEMSVLALGERSKAPPFLSFC